MRGGTVRLGLAVALFIVVCAKPAQAGDHDLTLERLIGPPTTPGGLPAVTTALRSAYAGLVSELGVVLAPPLLQPADSLGWSGFAASLDVSMTQLNRDADYWRSGMRDLRSTVVSTIGATVRKGLWLPFPSMELSFGGHKLLDSGLFTLEVGAKIALHEGFHRWPIPSVALHVSVARLFGTPQLSLTVVDAGLIVSKRFAVGPAVQLDPYLGVNAIVSFASSRVIDTTPNVGATDENALITLPDPDPLPRVRLQGGLRLRASLFQLTVEGAYVLCNATGFDCAKGGDTTVKDRSGGQAQLWVSAGLVY